MLSGPYRAGPWPGLTPRGALVLLACAVLFAWLTWFTPYAAVVPLVLATLIVRTPGAASAVAGAYLLPRTLWSVVDPSVPLPPLYLVPAMLFDLAVWLRRSDLRVTWPLRRYRKRNRSPRRITPLRVAAGVLLFLVTLAINQAFFSF